MTSIYSKLPSLPDYSAKWGLSDITGEGDYQLCEQGGVIGYYGGRSYSITKALDFMRGQCARYKVPIPQDDFLNWCWDKAFYYIDQYDPYILMSGCCDVIKTEEAYYYQYALSTDGKQWDEVSPDEVETFQYWEDGNKSWEELINSPGLGHYFDGVQDYLEDHMSYIKENQEYSAYEEEWVFINRYGDKIDAYVDIGVWSALMWMTSPHQDSKDWRFDFHPIFNICYEHGSCVLSGWTFHDPRYFQRIERKAMTCASCGTDSFCVQLTQTDKENLEFTCEHCLSGGMPFPGRTCGTRHCQHTSCEHHPASTAKTKEEREVIKKEMRMIAADKRFGKLHQLENGMHERDLPGYMKLNEIAINKYAGEISTTVSNVLSALLAPPKGE